VKLLSPTKIGFLLRIESKKMILLLLVGSPEHLGSICEEHHEFFRSNWLVQVLTEGSVVDGDGSLDLSNHPSIDVGREF